MSISVIDGISGLALGLALLLAIVIIIFKCLKRLSRANVDKHNGMLREAKIALKRIKRRKNPNKKEKIIHSLNHFVFEELVLLQLKKTGAQTLRNDRYTGDGGIDGRYRYSRFHRWNIVQAKHYNQQQRIRLQDVITFEQLCRKRKVSGLFITTGKSTSNIDNLVRQSSVITLIDQRNILDFFK